jgi:YD repeat-containing protein
VRTRRNNPKRLRARVRRMLLETLEDRRVMYGPGENNDTLSTAQPVQLFPNIPYTVSEQISGAEIDSRDVDMFRVELQSGARLIADLDALTSEFGTCISSLQGGIRLFGPDGKEVAATSEELLNGDPVRQFVASTTGVYTVGIASAENSNYAPDSTVNRSPNAHSGAYYLKLLTLPNVTDTSSIRRYTVNTHVDVVNPIDGYLSLREAISSIESSGAKGIIEFSLPDAFRTIELSQGALIVSGQVSIIGPTKGAHLVIRPATGSLSAGILQVNVGADVSLANVTLVDGKAGSGKGGNIRANGSLKLDSVELIGGSAMLGGGLYAGPGSRVHIERTTISGNQATNGGGVYIDSGARFSAVNSTFSGNTSQTAGAALTSVGNSSLMNVTIVNNGNSTGQSTVDAIGTVTLRNSLVGGNKTQAELVGLIESQGYNSFTQSSFVSSAAPFVDVLDTVPKIGPLTYQGGYAATHAPIPGSLAIDRGGAWGVAVSDQRGAPRVLDGFEPHASLDTIAQPDIGAFETGAYFVSTSMDEIDQTPLGDGVADSSIQPGLQISLRAAVQELNALTLGNAQTLPQKLEGVIFVDRGLLLNRYGSLEDSALTGDLDVHGRLRVESLGSAPFQITGGWDPTTPTGIDLRDRIWHVHPGADLTLANMAIGGGYVHSDEAGRKSQGGTVLVDNARLTLDHANLLGSQAQQGGAIYSRNAEVTLLSTVGRNSRAEYGGAVYLESGSVVLSGSELSSNGAYWGGGAIFVQSGDLSLRSKSRLSGNILTGSLVSYVPDTDTTSGMGAGILNLDGTVTIADESVLSGNFAPATTNTRYGNAIANYGTLQIFGGSSIQQNGVFTANAFVPPATDGMTVYAHYAIYNKGVATITESQILENQSGAIFNNGGELSIERVEFNRNTGNHFGTGIFNINGKVSIVDSRFEANWNPTYAPVIVNHDLDAETTIINSAFVDNQSENGAGAVLNRHGRVSISGSTFLNNVAINDGDDGSGGAIRNEGIHRFLTTLVGRTGVLDAAINPTQSEIYLQSLAPFRNLPLPFSIMVGNERMSVTAMDDLKVSFTVARKGGWRHEVSDVVRLIIDENQNFIMLDDPSTIARYKLPLNIIINTEILTITSLEGPLAYVERGRQGTVAQVHTYPIDVWGAAGGLEISSSTFIGNGLSFPGRSPDWDRGGAIYNVTDTLTPPTLIEASFFQGNQAVTGAAIYNELRYPIPALSSADLRAPDGRPIWGIVGTSDEVAAILKTLPHENIVIGSSVFTDNRHPDGRQAAAIDAGERLLTPSNASDVHWKSEPYALVPTQNLRSTGGNLVDADLVSFTFLEEGLSVNQNLLAIVLPKNTSLPVPFKARLSHATEQGLVVEDVTVTSLVTIPDPKATREPRVGVVFADEIWAQITIARGVDGTHAVNHPKGARFVVSLSGFTQPGDRIGTLKEFPFQFETELFDSDGISSTDTTVAVRDASRFPSVPFQIHVTQVNAPGKYEMMTVTAISGNLLTVERGTSYTDPIAHPNGSRIEYEWKTFDRLDVGYSSSTPISRTLYKNEFRADSPVIDRASSDADPVLTTSTSTSLPADYSQDVKIRFALTSVSVPFKGPLFATDVQLNVAPANGLPPVPFYALLEDEVLHVTAISADGKWTVTRGALGSNTVDHLLPTTLSIGLPIGPDASVLSLENTANLPEAPFIMEIGNELLRVTSIDQQARSIRVERGVLGTTAIRHEVAVVGGVGRWVEIDVDNPVPNVGAIGVLGNERVRVVATRPTNRAVLLERGFDRTKTENHSPKTSLLFHGSGTLGSLASPMLELDLAIAESTQTIRVLGPISPQVGTELGIDLEIMRVTRAVRVNREAWDLTVIRGVRGTSPTAHSSSAAVRLLVDGSFQLRTAAGLSGSNPIADIGATESDLIVVNTTEDLPDALIGDGKSVTSQGTVSLRAALQEAALTQRRVRIQLPSGTIRVSSELVIESNVEIVGAGADRTVVSADSSRVFRVPSGLNLKLSTLTLIGNAGSANGGALLIEGGRVEFLNSVVRDSRATDGAAIAVSSGTMLLFQSSLINNVGVRGGAMSIFSGQVEMRGATLSGNRANTGGAIYVSPQAGISINNSTIAYNEATQAAAIDNKGSVTSLSSIFANNNSGTSNSKLTGRFVSRGFNLLDVQPDATSTTASFLNAEDVTAQLVITQQLTAPPAVPFDIRVSNSETMTVVAVQGTTLSVVRSADRTLRKQHSPGAPIRTDGFWSTGDQSGTVTAPLDAKLVAIRAGDDGVPVHSLAADSPAVDTSNEALFQGRSLLLATGALPGDTQIVLQSSDGLPPAPFRISIQDRKYLVTRVQDRTLELSANVAGLAPGSSEERGLPFFRQGTAVQILTDATGASRIVDYPNQSTGGSSGWGNFYGGGYGSYIPPGMGGSTGPMPPTSSPAYQMDIGAVELVERFAISSAHTSVPESTQFSPSTFQFTVTRSGITNRTTTVEYIIRAKGENGVEPTDFVSGWMPRATLTFAAGETEKTVSIAIAFDDRVEGDEAFEVVLVPTNADVEIPRATFSGLIQDDDLTTIRFNVTSPSEGKSVIVVATTDKIIEGGLSLSWQTSGGTATADLDYRSASGVITWTDKLTANEAAEVFTTDDQIVERNETMRLLFQPLFASSVIGRVTIPTEVSASILNNDRTQLTIRNTGTIEGNTGTKTATFELTSSHAVDVPFSVTVVGIAATASVNTDFTATSRVLNFSGGAGEALTYSSTVVGDTVIENDETYSVRVQNVQAAGRESSIVTNIATGTIWDDERAKIIVTPSHATEGASGTTEMVFNVTLVKPQGSTVKVTASTAPSTATAGADYTHTSSVLTFTGTSVQTLTFTVPIIGDKVVEGEETFLVNLSNLQASTTYTLVNGTGTILNDDTSSLRMVIPEEFQPKPGEDPNKIIVAGSSAGIPALQLELDAAVSGTVTASVNVRWVGQTTTSTPQTVQFTGVAGQRFSIPITAPADYSSSRDLAIQVTDVSASGMAVSGGGNFVVHFDADRPASMGQVCAGPSHRDPYRNTNTQGTGNYLPIPILIKIYSERSPEGYLIGYWATKDGFRVPGPGWYQGKLYTANPDEVPDTSLAVPGDIGFGRDLYGYAIIPMMRDGIEFLMGSVDRKLYGTVEDFRRSNPGAERSEDGPGSCETEESGDEPDPPTPLPAPGPKAAWTVSHKEPITFRPAITANHFRSENLVLTVLDGTRYAMPGASVKLKYGEVRVNADNSLTYTPDPNLKDREANAMLTPQMDARGLATQFIGSEVFDVHLVERKQLVESAGDASVVKSNVSEQMQLMVANHLPALTGSLIHNENPEASKLDGSIYVGLDTIYRVDLRDLYSDADGDLDDLKFQDIRFKGKGLDADGKLAIKIGETKTRNRHTGMLQTRTVKELIITRISDSIFEIHNTAEPRDVALSDEYGSLWSSVAEAAELELEIIASDGQKLKLTDESIAKHSWKLSFSIVPNNKYETNSLWTNQPGIPDFDRRSWLQPVTPTNEDIEHPVADLKDWKITAYSSVDVSKELRQEVAGVDVNMIDGSFRLRHELPTAPNSTEHFALPSLVYDSSIVYNAGRNTPIIYGSLEKKGGPNPNSVAGKLIWTGLDDTNAWVDVESPISITPIDDAEQYRFAVRPSIMPNQHGVYGWRLELDLSFVIDADNTQVLKLVTQGETPVLVGDQTAIFGAGWTFEDMPWFYMDHRGSIDTPDDRLVITFPGQAPLLFDAGLLFANDFAHVGPLPNVVSGSSTFGGDGFKEATEFGTLEAVEGKKLVYTLPDGTRITAKLHELEDSKRFYLIESTERPYANEDPASPAPRRRVLNYQWKLPPETNFDHPVLSEISTADGTKMALSYTADGYLDYANHFTPAGVAFAVTDFNLDAQRRLVGIVHYPVSNTTPVAVDLLQRYFVYEGDVIAREGLWNSQQKVMMHRQFLFESGDGSLRLTGIRFNELPTADSAFAFNEPAVTHSITTAGVRPGNVSTKLTSSAKITKKVDNLKGLVSDGSGGWTETDTSGSVEIELETDSKYQLSRELQSFVAKDGSKNVTSEQRYRYDIHGNVKHVRERIGDGTELNSFENRYYWRDYEVPYAVTGTVDPKDSKDTRLSYDENDYRGNVIVTLSSQGLTAIDYVTDDELGHALGQASAVYEILPIYASISASAVLGRDSRVTTTDYGLDGQVLLQRTILGSIDSATTRAPDDLQDVVAVYAYYEEGPNFGLLKSTTSPTLLKTEYVYASGRLQKETQNDPVTNIVREIHYTYDVYGFVDVVKQTAGGVVLTVIDSDHSETGQLLHRKVEAADSTGTLVTVANDTYQVDGLGNVVRHVDGIGRVNEYKFDSLGRLREEIIASGATHYALYLDQAVDVSRKVNYEYYNDGSLKSSKPSDGFEERYYYSPLERKSWSRSSGISAGPHQIANNSITFNLNGVQVIENQTDYLGRTVSQINHFTGANSSFEYGILLNENPTRITEKANLGWTDGHWDVTDVVTDLLYDRNGNLLRQTAAGSLETIYKYDAAGRIASTFARGKSDGARSSTLYYQYDAAGQVTEFTEERRTGASTNLITTKNRYSATGDLISSSDALAGIEAGTVAVTVTSTFAGGLEKRVSTSREGLVETEWVNGYGQVVRKQLATGAQFEYVYDLAGRMIKEVFIPRVSDSLPSSQQVNEYDALDRLRVRYNQILGNGAISSSVVSAVDYFAVTDNRADGFQVIEFDPFVSADIVLQRPANDRARTNRTKTDAVGNVLYVQTTDPDPSANAPRNTPTQLFTYEFDKSNVLAIRTSRTSSADTATGGIFPMDLNESDARVLRSVSSIQGWELLTLGKLHHRDVLDQSQTSSLVDPGYVIKSRNKVNKLGDVVQIESPIGAEPDAEPTVDLNQDMQTTKYALDGLGRLSRVTQHGGHWMDFTYDSANNAIQEKHWNGQWSVTDYDALGRPTEVLSYAHNLHASGPFSYRPDLAAVDQVFESWDYEGPSMTYTNKNGWKRKVTTNIAMGLTTEVSTLDGESITDTRLQFSDGTTDSANRSVTSIDSLRNGFSTSTDSAIDFALRSTTVKSSYVLGGRVSPIHVEYSVANELGHLIEQRNYFVAPGTAIENLANLEDSRVQTLTYGHDAAGRVIRVDQKVADINTKLIASNFAPRDKRMDISYIVDRMAQYSIYEMVDGKPYSQITSKSSYDGLGRLWMNEQRAQTAPPAKNSSGNEIPSDPQKKNIDSTFTYFAQLTSGGRVEGVKRVLLVDETSGIDWTERTEFEYSNHGEVISQVSHFDVRDRIFNTPSVRSTRDIHFDVAPGGRATEDAEFRYFYDQEGNLARRVAKFETRTIDHTASGIIAAPSDGVVTIPGSFPKNTPEQWVSESSSQSVSFQVPLGELEPGKYDLWLTWKGDRSYGNGEWATRIRDKYTTEPSGAMKLAYKLQGDLVLYGWPMKTDKAEGTIRRALEQGGNEWHNVSFLKDPIYPDAEGVRWDNLGTIQISDPAEVMFLLRDVSGIIAFDAIRITPHVAVETTSYDMDNRPIISTTSALIPNTPSATIHHFYDAMGKEVLTANKSDASTLEFTASGYMGARPMYRYSFEPNATYRPSIQSLNFYGNSTQPVAVDHLDGVARMTSPDAIQTSFLFVQPDGKVFTQTGVWSASEHVFVGLHVPEADTSFSDTRFGNSRGQYRGTAQENPWMAYFSSEMGHAVLDAIGVLDPFGVADGINAVWYLSEGNYAGAALSAVGMVPLLGDAAKLGRGAVKGFAKKGAVEAAENCGVLVKMQPQELLLRAGKNAAAGAVVGGVIGGSVAYATGGNIAEGTFWGAYKGAASGFSRGFFRNRFKEACFTAGTPLVVDLEGNSRPIEEIQVGDYVLARNEFDPQGPLELKKVEELFVRTSAVMELVVQGQIIKTTAEHPFYVPAQQRFVPAGELQLGDMLIGSQGGLIPIESLSILNDITTVYNFRVADHHTYFVGGTEWGWDIWVHNAECVTLKGKILLKNNQEVKEVQEIITNATTKAEDVIAKMTSTTAKTDSNRINLYLSVLKAREGDVKAISPKLLAKFTKEGKTNWDALEAMTKGHAIQAVVDRSLLANPITKKLFNDERLLLNQGSQLGLKNGKANLVKPDYQLKLADGKWATFDITTYGQQGKAMQKYAHRDSPFLFEILYRSAIKT